MMSGASRTDAISHLRLALSHRVAEDQEQRVPTTIQTVTGEFWYDGYKEPLVQLDSGFPGQPQGVQLKAAGSDQLACAFCGKAYHNLGIHAARKHGLKAPEYKREVGLLQKSALVSETTRMRNTAHALRVARTSRFGHGDRARAVAASKAALVSLRKFGHGKASPEARNLGGHCYAQVIAVAREVQRQYGKITDARMRRHRIHGAIINTYFGSWENFLRHMNETVQRSGREWRDDDLLTALRSLAEELGRTPTVSDMKRYGLPWRQTYKEHFGSWQAACERAGIPWRGNGGMPRPYTEEEDIAVLSAYAILGSIYKVGRKLQISTERAGAILGRFGIGSLNSAFGHSEPQRREQMALAATVAARIAGWPEEVSA
jgi:hypothetical protein